MKRKIKYRVWDKVDKKFMAFMDGDIVSGQIYSPHPIEEFIIQQFTGMLDKNGIEIYEGDILKTHGWRGSIVNVEVIWEETMASDDMGCSMVGFRSFDEYGDVEVIGNIFENPELLKK